MDSLVSSSCSFFLFLFLVVPILAVNTLPTAASTGNSEFDVDLGLTREQRLSHLKAVAAVPLKGWNSWDAFGVSADESIILAHIDYIAANLLPYGYNIVVIDEGWYVNLKNDSWIFMDEYGRAQVDPVRFPSSQGNQGFKSLSRYAHSRGLLLGIHIMRAMHIQAATLQLPIFNTNFTANQVVNNSGACPWYNDWHSLDYSHPAAQLYLDSVYQQYAEWGIDFIKNDCVFAEDMTIETITATSNAMEKSGRDFLYSLSPGQGATLPHANSVAQLTNLYRITRDVWDSWDHIEDHITDSIIAFIPFIGYPAGRLGLPSFPDLDMLPFGKLVNGMGRLTNDEQITLLTYWSVWRSPRFYGGDLRSPDTFSLSLLSNLDALNLTDHTTHNRPVVQSAISSIWRADHQDYQTNGISYFTVHNWDAVVNTITISMNLIRPPQSGTTCLLKNIWVGKELGSFSNYTVTLQPHASTAYVVHDCTNNVEPTTE